MGTKLTLTLDDSIIRNAKKYAKTNKISLSKMVEFYFKYISSKIVNKKYKIPPITKELSGLSKFKTSKTDKELLTEALLRKHT